MPFHQDWTDKVIEDVANNLQETGLVFFFLLPTSVSLPPHRHPQQPIPAAFLKVDGTVEKCKFMADDDFSVVY